MSIVELIPLDKGHRLILENDGITTIGRTPNIGCLDKKISRSHAQLYHKPDGTVWIKPIHSNPTFFKTKSGKLVSLKKDEEYQLRNSDVIGLLPTQYFYQISIQSTKNKKVEETKIDTPVDVECPRAPTPPIEKVKSPKTIDPAPMEIVSPNPTIEPEGGILLHKKRPLPIWMAQTTAAESKSPKRKVQPAKAKTPTKTPSPSKYRTYIRREKSEGIVYEDDEDSNETTPVANTENRTATSKPIVQRERCPYGKFCYRKNPDHRQEAIHPGDPDWDDKENDTITERPTCPYGTDCYRTNPAHLQEFDHSQSKTERRSSKRSRAISDDDDDGLPNEYDYKDSFIDDEELDESVLVDRAGALSRTPDADWRPHQKATATDVDDDYGNSSTDDSELNLLKDEAIEFLNGNLPTNEKRSAKKKARTKQSTR